MRISGTEPSSVILSQTCSIKKMKSNDQKVPKQAEAKRDGVINPQNYNLDIIDKETAYRYPLPQTTRPSFRQAIRPGCEHSHTPPVPHLPLSPPPNDQTVLPSGDTARV